MSAGTTAVWAVLDQLQERARRMEEEVAALRADVEKITRALDRPVATYVLDGEKLTITEADVARVRSGLLSSHSKEALRTIALADKISELRQDLPPEERERLFWENVEAIRAPRPSPTARQLTTR